MSIIKRSHNPVWNVCRIINNKSFGVTGDLVLQITAKSARDSTRPDNIGPTLAVYEAIPRLRFLRDRLSVLGHQRAIVIKKATQVLANYFASRQVRKALRMQNGSKFINILYVRIASHALVFKTKHFLGKTFHNSRY